MTFWRSIRVRRGYFLIALGLLAADQITKLLADRFLAARGPLEVIPSFFSLDYSTNAGGLFGYFSDLPAVARLLLLSGLPIVAIGMIVWFLARSQDETRLTLFGLSLILGGATGNLIDRLSRQEVVDFLDVYIAPSSAADWLVKTFGTAHWPTFNVADSGIVVGACVLALTIVLPRTAAKPAGQIVADDG